MATPKVYVICDANCKWEGMTKEQILTAIVQAVNDGSISNVDTGFVQTIKTITGTPLRFFVGTQAEYDTLTAEDKENLFAIITNDSTKDGMLSAIETLQQKVTDLGTQMQGGWDALGNGDFPVDYARTAGVANALNNPMPTEIIDAGEGTFKLDAGSGLYAFYIRVEGISGESRFYTVLMYYNALAQAEGGIHHAGAVGTNYTVYLGTRSDGTIYTHAESTSGTVVASYIYGYIKIC